MKRLLLPFIFVLALGCYPAYYVPPGAVAVPPGEAERIAMNFSRSQGFNPIGVRWIRLRGDGRVWDVMLTLGGPQCGVERVHVGHWDGRVYGARPAIYACGYYYAEPPPPAY